MTQVTDTDVRDLILSMEQRMTAQINGASAKLEGKIDAVSKKLEDKIDTVSKKLEDKIDAVAADVNDLKIAQAKNDERFNSIDQRFNNVEQRLDTFEDRIKTQDNRFWGIITGMFITLFGLLAKMAFFPGTPI